MEGSRKCTTGRVSGGTRGWGRKLVPVLAVLMVVGGVACDPNEEAEVFIVYKQLAYFDTYKTDPDSSGTHGAGPKEIFVMYGIASIRNDDPQAQTFEFDPDRLVSVGDEFSTDHAGDEAQLLGAYQQQEETVPPGDMLTSGLGCVIMTVVSDDLFKQFGGVSGTSRKVDLMHQVEAEQPVRVQRNGGNDSGFTGLGPADPETLQNICASG